MRKESLPFGIELAQLVSLAARTSQILSGFITLLMVGFFFDLKTQGYFYTFNSLIALQVFAEMGLSMVLIQFSAHEMAKLRWSHAVVEGDPVAKARLRSLMTFSFGWFGITASLLLVVLIPSGYWFFTIAAGRGGAPPGVLSSWALLVLFVSGNLIVTALCNIIEGTGKVSEVATVRLVQATSGAIVAWVAIMMDAGLHALAWQSLMQLVAGLAYLVGWRRRFVTDLLSASGTASSLKWRTEIFPFQWRIAISWLSGYFIFQFSTPLLFSAQGPEAAGRMGMSMQIFSALSSICIIFVSARIPVFGRLVASRARSELNRLFSRSVVQSFVTLVVAISLVLVALALFDVLAPGMRARVLPLSQSLLLAVSTLGSHAVYAQSIYLRTHKQEPFMRLSIINGAVMAALASWAIPRFGTVGAVSSYAVVTLALSLPVGTWIFLRFKSDSHDAAAG